MVMDLVWQPIADRDGKLVGKLNGALAGPLFRPATTRLRRTLLPFFSGVSLVEAADSRTEPAVEAWFLMGEDFVRPLDGGSAPFLEVAARGRLRLTAATVASYVRLYCLCLETPKDSFALVEDPEDVVWAGTPSAAQRKQVNALVHPAEITEESQGVFLLDGRMVHDGGIFDVTVRVAPDGGVRMLRDDPLATGLPILAKPPVQ